MPEVNPFLNKEFVKEISNEKQESILPDIEKFKEITENFGIKVVGSGNECIVVDDPESKEKVIAINYKNLSPEEAKDIYYSSKIWNTLFPHNFPKIHSANARTESDTLSGTVRQKITGKTLHDQDYSFKQMMESDFKEKVSLTSVMKNIKNYLLNKKVETKYPFAEAFTQMEILSKEPYNLPFFIDTNTKNFIKTDDGNEYYVEGMRIGSILEDKIDISKLENYMKEKNYDQSDIQKVVSSINRLNEIFVNNKQDQ